MNDNAVTRTVKTMGSYTLRHIRRTLEAELLADVAADVKFTQAHVGKLEMMEAAGAELYSRPGNELVPPAPWIATNTEDGIRYSITMKVY
jgi:hypothetical protein